MTTAPGAIEKALIDGDLSLLSEQDRLFYYKKLCEVLGLNPLLKPFLFLKDRKGKLGIYANKNCADQLRSILGITVEDLRIDRHGDLVTVTVTVTDRNGRKDSDVGVVSLQNLQGEECANALMKAVTKAKRRATLALAGAGVEEDISFLEVEEATDSTQNRKALIAQVADQIKVLGLSKEQAAEIANDNGLPDSLKKMNSDQILAYLELLGNVSALE